MQTYTLTCSCGYTMDLEAEDRDEAVRLFQGGMTQEFIDSHFAEHHQPGEAKPTPQQALDSVSQMVTPEA